MAFSYHELGELTEGSRVTVSWRTWSANVILLDPVNFANYTNGRPFFYTSGGYFRSSPAVLEIPEAGRWYVVVDLGGHSQHVKAAVEVSESPAPASVAAPPPSG